MRFIIPLPAIALLLLLFSTGAVFAKPWSVEVQQWQATQFENSRQAIKRRQSTISYHWSQEQTEIGLSYSYQPVLIRNDNPAHNGHFNQFDLSFRLHHGLTRVEFTSGIHGSSNMFQNFEFHKEALVSKFSVIHPVSNDAAHIGINGDYRFGHFRVYPRISISKILSKGSELTIDLPVALLWKKHHWQIGIRRYGEKWAALDSERKNESAFYLNEWRLSGRWQRPVSRDKVTFELGAGVSFSSRVRYLDLFRGWQEKDLESALFILLGMKF